MSDKMTPEIRFRGFSDDWEQRKLGDILKVNSGRDYKHLHSGNIPVYGTGGYMLSVDDKLSQQDGIGIGRKGTIDKPQYLSAPFWTVDTLFYLTPLNNHKLKFIQQITYIINWKKYSEQTGVPSLSKNSIEKIDINVPEITEQTKISELLRTLDNTIALHLFKLEMLKKLKRGYLQVMFPENQRTIPYLRFANFSSPWEQRRLGEVKDIRDGTHDSPKYHKTGHPLVTSKNLSDSGLNMGDISLINNTDFNRINKRSQVDINDILFGMIGSIGHPVLISRNDFAIKNVALIKNNQEIPNHFLLQLLKSPIFNKYIKNKSAGNTQKFLGLNTIRNFIFNVPETKEQNKIGSIFRQLDNNIALHQAKTEKLQQIKKAYLQKMFI
ncbi:restriction endonuclease subunit S [Dellaglioa algida]|nr:restriction endonuclease subunit S [Dellaglioa algida]